MVQATKIYRVEESEHINGEWNFNLNSYYSSRKKALEAARTTAMVMAQEGSEIEDETKKYNRIWYTNKKGNYCSIYIHTELLF